MSAVEGLSGGVQGQPGVEQVVGAQHIGRPDAGVGQPAKIGMPETIVALPGQPAGVDNPVQRVTEVVVAEEGMGDLTDAAAAVTKIQDLLYSPAGHANLLPLNAGIAGAEAHNRAVGKVWRGVVEATEQTLAEITASQEAHEQRVVAIAPDYDAALAAIPPEEREHHTLVTLPESYPRLADALDRVRAERAADANVDGDATEVDAGATPVSIDEVARSPQQKTLIALLREGPATPEEIGAAIMKPEGTYQTSPAQRGYAIAGSTKSLLDARNTNERIVLVDGKYALVTPESTAEALPAAEPQVADAGGTGTDPGAVEGAKAVQPAEVGPAELSPVQKVQAVFGAQGEASTTQIAAQTGLTPVEVGRVMAKLTAEGAAELIRAQQLEGTVNMEFVYGVRKPEVAEDASGAAAGDRDRVMAVLDERTRADFSALVRATGLPRERVKAVLDAARENGTIVGKTRLIGDNGRGPTIEYARVEPAPASATPPAEPEKPQPQAATASVSRTEMMLNLPMGARKFLQALARHPSDLAGLALELFPSVRSEKRAITRLLEVAGKTQELVGKFPGFELTFDLASLEGGHVTLITPRAGNGRPREGAVTAPEPAAATVPVVEGDLTAGEEVAPQGAQRGVDRSPKPGERREAPRPVSEDQVVDAVTGAYGQIKTMAGFRLDVPDTLTRIISVETAVNRAQAAGVPITEADIRGYQKKKLITNRPAAVDGVTAADLAAVLVLKEFGTDLSRPGQKAVIRHAREARDVFAEQSEGRNVHEIEPEVPAPDGRVKKRSARTKYAQWVRAQTRRA